MQRTIVLLSLTLLLCGSNAFAQTREEKVRADRKKFDADSLWIYGDLAKGFTEAKKSGKPMLVVFRCIPCEECVKLDDDLLHENKRIRELLEKFTCVRIVSTNGLDLSLFQFDYDQSFAAFLLNADGAVYGRYGTRSHRTSWSDDVSIEGLAKALEGALDLHGHYPANKAELAAKRGPAPAFPSPEKYPSLKDRYKSTLDYEGKVVPSCIHCHQVGDAQRQVYFDKKEQVPEQVLLPYPHPKAIGLILDPRERASVLRVEPDSPAEKAGFKKGDVIQKLDGQSLLSIADVQFVLHHTDPKGATLKATVQRDGRPTVIALKLPSGWRLADDISWRASTWPLRGKALGGMLLKTMTAEERKQAGMKETGMALNVDWVGGGSGIHSFAAKAGVQKGDIVISFDGRDDLARETDVILSNLRNHQPGDIIEMEVLRKGKSARLKLTMPN